MGKRKIRLLDTVALLEDLPERRFKRGEVGTVVKVLAPDVLRWSSVMTKGKHTPSLRCSVPNSSPCIIREKH